MTPDQALERYREAVEALALSRIEAGEAANQRAQALHWLHQLGWSYQKIATEVGLTRARVQQLVEKGRTL